MNNFRFAFRQLVKNPGFTLIAIVTLALGIGANTSMFSFANSLLLRPIPYPNPDELVRLQRVTPNNYFGGFSPADFLDLRQAQGAFGRFAGYHQSNLTLTDTVRPPEWFRVSADLFAILGVRPLIGRTFRPEEEMPGNQRVALLSYRFWQTHFDSRADIIGKTVHADNQTFEIIGVLPKSAADHRLFGQAGLFSPLSFTEQERLSREARWVNVLGRRNEALTEAQGAAFIEQFGSRLAADFAAENADSRWRAERASQSSMSPAGKALIAMLIALSSFVLLIACSNLANLLLARVVNSTREFTVRAALGASRWRLLAPITCEMIILAALGGVGALLVTQWTTEWLRSIIVNGGGPSFEFPIDRRVLAFAMTVSLLVIMVFGLGAAMFVAGIKTADGLKGGARGTTVGPGYQRLRHILIVGQFTLAMILLGGAGLFMRGSLNMMRQDFGWSAENVVQANLLLPEERYPGAVERAVFYERLEQRLKGVPGLRGVSLSFGLPFLGLRTSGGFIAEGAEASQENRGLAATLNDVSPDFFNVTGTRLIAGRAFRMTDRTDSPRVAIINQAMAQALFPGEDTLGKRIGPAGANSPEWLQIVGIVESVKAVDVSLPLAPHQFYQPISQHPGANITVAALVEGTTPATVLGPIRQAIASLDADLPVRNLTTSPQAMKFITSQMKLAENLLRAFAILGLLLATLGIYGAIARLVAQRTAEIGIRMALGAQLADVARLVFASGFRIAGTGALLGFLGAASLSKFIASFLPRLQGDAGWVLPIATALLIAAAFGACWIPARRATRINPLEALRYE